MKLRRAIFVGVTAALLAVAGLFAVESGPAGQTVSSTPVYVPDFSHANDPMPDGVIAWSSLLQTTNVDTDAESVRFTFSFTNAANRAETSLVTNIVAAGSTFQTNIIAATNFTLTGVAIQDVHASCGCTQPEVPPMPWIIPPGGSGVFSATVNLEGMTGTLVKYITVTTDKGSKNLYMQINVHPVVIPSRTDAERAHDMEIAKTDRQAVFNGECAKCHAKSVSGKYGEKLYAAACAVCHDAEHRATVVPDLHNLKANTNDEFWRTWIAHGKPGSLMPAFATADGGPLNDMQIATLAAYLNTIIPSRTAPARTTAPAN